MVQVLQWPGPQRWRGRRLRRHSTTLTTGVDEIMFAERSLKLDIVLKANGAWCRLPPFLENGRRYPRRFDRFSDRVLGSRTGWNTPYFPFGGELTRIAFAIRSQSLHYNSTKMQEVDCLTCTVRCRLSPSWNICDCFMRRRKNVVSVPTQRRETLRALARLVNPLVPAAPPGF